MGVLAAHGARDLPPAQAADRQGYRARPGAEALDADLQGSRGAAQRRGSRRPGECGARGFGLPDRDLLAQLGEVSLGQ